MNKFLTTALVVGVLAVASAAGMRAGKTIGTKTFASEHPVGCFYKGPDGGLDDVQCPDQVVVMSYNWANHVGTKNLHPGRPLICPALDWRRKGFFGGTVTGRYYRTCDLA